MKKIIEISNIYTQFDKNVIHRNLSFDLRKGEVLGLLGGSGTGKSLILRSIIRLHEPNKGTISYKNKNILKMNERDITKVRTEISYVFQSGALFDSMTVFDNLAYPLRAHLELSEPELENKVMAMLHLVGLPHTRDLLPASLSGGMQKRIGLARSIIMDPDVILYDEPTAGLDPNNTNRINELINNLKKEGKSAILVSHDMPSVKDVCDRVALLYEKEIYRIEETDKFLNSQDPIIKNFLEGDS